MEVPDFDGLHRQLADLSKFAVKQRMEESVTDLVTAIERDQRRLENSYLSQRQRIDGPFLGARYAAREIGQTIIYLAGFKALFEAHARIEREVGEREAVFLSRAWTGLDDPRGDFTWSD